MTQRLVRAAKDRHEATLKRATTALRDMATEGAPITFVAVARRAGVSTDFLYNTPTLRSRINDLRGEPSSKRASDTPTEPETARNSSAVRALSTQLKELRRRHPNEIAVLEKALAAAHGENLELRRRLAQTEADEHHSTSSVRYKTVRNLP